MRPSVADRLRFRTFLELDRSDAPRTLAVTQVAQCAESVSKPPHIRSVPTISAHVLHFLLAPETRPTRSRSAAATADPRTSPSPPPPRSPPPSGTPPHPPRSRCRPSPITGIFTACAAWYTRRSAIGLIAGPESPPKPAPIRGRRRARIHRQRDERIHQRDRVRARSPPPPAPAARSPLTFGESFTISGRRATACTAATTSASSAGSLEK